MPVVTVARQRGSGGTEVAAQAAERLGARLVDRELLTLAAERSGLPLAVMEAMDERGRDLLRRPLDLVRLVPLPPVDTANVQAETYPPTGPIMATREGILAPIYWASEAFVQLFQSLIQEMAQGGNAVILGRGGMVALRHHPGTLHVLVVAPAELRGQRVAARTGLELEDALAEVRRDDRDRSGYYRQFFHADWTDPLLYDLVINTVELPLDKAADIVVDSARLVEAGIGAGVGSPIVTEKLPS